MRARDGGGLEARADREVGSRRSHERLRVREVPRRPPEVLADELDRAVELVGHVGSRRTIEQPVCVGVRADVDEAGRAGVAQRRPGERRAVVGERELLVDEASRDVERDGHRVLDEHRERDVGEVGGAVVEGHRDHRLRRCARVREAGHALREADQRPRGGQERHLLGEARPREVDLERGAPAHPVVDEHHEASRGPAHHVDRGGPCLDRRPHHAHGHHGNGGTCLDPEIV